MGNYPVRFLGEDAAARPHPYPTDDGGGVGLEHHTCDFARVDRGAIDGAAEERLGADEPVPIIEQQQAEDLVR